MRLIEKRKCSLTGCITFLGLSDCDCHWPATSGSCCHIFPTRKECTFNCGPNKPLLCQIFVIAPRIVTKTMHTSYSCIPKKVPFIMRKLYVPFCFLMCIGGFPASVSVWRCQNSWTLNQAMISENCCVGTGNWTWVLWRGPNQWATSPVPGS